MSTSCVGGCAKEQTFIVFPCSPRFECRQFFFPRGLRLETISKESLRVDSTKCPNYDRSDRKLGGPQKVAMEGGGPSSRGPKGCQPGNTCHPHQKPEDSLPLSSPPRNDRRLQSSGVLTKQGGPGERYRGSAPRTCRRSPAAGACCAAH